MFHNYCEVQRPAAKLSVNDDTTYGCDMCDSGGWLSETEVEMHKKSVHLRQLTRLISSELNICRTCVKIFPDHNALIEHIKFKHFHSSKTARRIEREIFVCDHCYQIFFNKRMLEVHIVHRHMKKPHSILLDCPLCLKKKSSQVMYNHMMHHNSHSVSVCPICLHKQRNRKALAQHLDTHRKHYHCNICGYISTKEKDFNMHLDTYERRKRSFKVKNYKKCFLKPFPTHRWSYNCLKVGLQGLIIFNEIYICVLCRQLCTNHTDMQEHILRDHSSEPDTTETVAKKVCSCGEQFSNVILLKHHIFKNKGQCRLSCK
ncbi:hypothetical protein ABMA27_012201 [Loxostege sticticalis]|uniref:C2H2-type domain-containing protein n=1 Tax=Loxostege sticticalis TaxID=481309 RepID=A0ABR3H0V3_LOXSC